MRSTCDLLDEHPEVAVCLMPFRQFGGITFRPGAMPGSDDDGIAVLEAR